MGCVEGGRRLWEDVGLEMVVGHNHYLYSGGPFL